MSLSNYLRNIISILVLIWIFRSNCWAIESYIKHRFGPFGENYIQISDYLIQKSKTEDNLNHLRTNNRLQNIVPETDNFPCNTKEGRSLLEPRSVHRLRPGDIDVIGAIGDSQVVGMGLMAGDIFTVLAEHRGKSFAGGGEGTWRELLTLPNILKVFNPSLYGYSTDACLSDQSCAGLNVAEGGAASSDLLFMTKRLLNRTRNDPFIDVNRHWKMITILIGANDFCTSTCKFSIRQTLKNHENDLVSALRLLRDNLPRTIINLMTPPDVFASLDAHFPVYCDVLRRYYCPCMYKVRRKKFIRRYYEEFIRRWHKLDEEIASRPEFDNDNFTVVFQPHMVYVEIPKKLNGKNDESFFAIDCFHPSLKGNAVIAKSLWNNMLRPVGSKSYGLEDEDAPLLCPNKTRPYIATRRNSFY